MADDLPGFVPRVLQLDDVSLLRADEAVLNAMVDGWRAQMLARGLAVSRISDLAVHEIDLSLDALQRGDRHIISDEDGDPRLI
jgi:hypothetical protein